MIDCGSDVGCDICRFFTGNAIREFGADAFRASRSDTTANANRKDNK